MAVVAVLERVTWTSGHFDVSSPATKDTLRMEMGHSSQYRRCAILVLVDLSFVGALGEVCDPRLGNQGIRVHISQLEYLCQATRLFV